jgi:protein-S-isoprenylcysteine O-methyltransferase Ste14
MNSRYFLPAFLVAYFFAAFAWRSYQVWKKTGINPVTFKGSDSAHDFIGQIFKLVFVLVVIAVLLHALIPSAYTYTVPIVGLERGWLRWIGVGLLLASFIWTVVAQAQMGESWRIGVDSEHRTPLVQAGVFRISRNPIFLGLQTTLLGLFLTLPNLLTVIAFVLGVVVVGIQVRLEEEHLSRIHPKEYAEYLQRVPRWL